MKTRNIAPVVLFVYNRVEHTKKTIESLLLNTDASLLDVYIFSDGPKDDVDDKQKVAEVREYVSNIKGFNSVDLNLSESNIGLANSVINGVSRVISKHGRVIVLEDDILTSKNFILYMNEMLDYFENNNKIWSISGFTYPVNLDYSYKKEIYLYYRASSWGWATWYDRWILTNWEISRNDPIFKKRKLQDDLVKGGDDLFFMLKAQLNKRINSWAIRWCYSQFKNQMYTVYPIISKVKNIGNDFSGTHCGIGNNIEVNLDSRDCINNIDCNVTIDNSIVKQLQNYYRVNKLRHFIVNLLMTIGIYRKVYRVYLRLKSK